MVDGYMWKERFMHSRILAFVGAGALMVASSAAVLAQDATPAGEATPAAGSLLAELGLPELTIIASADGLAVEPAEVPAGRYLVTLEGEEGNPELFTGLVQVPDDRTLDDLSAADEIAAGTPIPEEGFPPESFAWLYETYIAGGPSSVTEHSRQVVVNLPAGNYGVWSEDPMSETPAAALTVTGEAGAEITGPEPEAAVTIVETGEGGVGYKFDVQGDFQAGPQIVKVLNASDQPHFVEASQYPEEVTIEQVQATFMFDPSTGATPSPDMLDFEQVSYAGWAGTQSIGTTQWTVFDLQPGQVLIDCFIPDPLAGGTPHAFEGMLQLFEVTG
jgi:hypothetical protein